VLALKYRKGEGFRQYFARLVKVEGKSWESLEKYLFLDYKEERKNFNEVKNGKSTNEASQKR
jgi:predicted NAD-dependent protein-ADP-ribosyltransferase YbiA (DUF1768 family)